MKGSELNLYLLKSIPEIKEKYEEETSWQEKDETGSHTVFGNVFTPYLLSCGENKDFENLKKCFDFIEDILLANDEYSEEVIAFSVLERIYDETGKNYEKFMKARTRKLFEEIVHIYFSNDFGI